MRLLLTVLLWSTACASGPSLQQAVTLHNTVRHIVLAADDAYTPIYDAAYQVAALAHPDDDLALHVALKPYDAVVDSLTAAKLLEQSLHLAVDQWTQGLDDGTMTREAAACSSVALAALAAHSAEIPTVGQYIYGACQALSFQLQQFASGTACQVKP